jgi:hypothetical protein
MRRKLPVNPMHLNANAQAAAAVARYRSVRSAQISGKSTTSSILRK